MNNHHSTRTRQSRQATNGHAQKQLALLNDQATELYAAVTHRFIGEWMTKVGPVATCVLLALAKHADFKSGECYPSLPTIAKIVGRSVRHVQRALTDLESHDPPLLVIERRGKGAKGHDANLYRIPRQVVTPVSLPGDAGVTGGGDTGVARVVTPVSQERPPENDHHGNDHQTTKPRRAAAVSAESITLPSPLDVPEVRQALADWIAYKRTKGQGYKLPDHLQRKVTEFVSPAEFVAAVNHCIGSNYDGLFPAPIGKANEKHRTQVDRRGPGQIFDPSVDIAAGWQ